MSRTEELEKEFNQIVDENAPHYGIGILEASVDESESIIRDIKDVFNKHGKQFRYNFSIMSSNQKSDSMNYLVCAGVTVKFEFSVKGKDSNGKNGDYSKEDLANIKRIGEEIRAIEEKKEEDKL